MNLVSKEDKVIYLTQIANNYQEVPEKFFRALRVGDLDAIIYLTEQVGIPFEFFFVVNKEDLRNLIWIYSNCYDPITYPFLVDTTGTTLDGRFKLDYTYLPGARARHCSELRYCLENGLPTTLYSDSINKYMQETVTTLFELLKEGYDFTNDERLCALSEGVIEYFKEYFLRCKDVEFSIYMVDIIGSHKEAGYYLIDGAMQDNSLVPVIVNTLNAYPLDSRQGLRKLFETAHELNVDIHYVFEILQTLVDPYMVIDSLKLQYYTGNSYIGNGNPPVYNYLLELGASTEQIDATYSRSDYKGDTHRTLLELSLLTGRYLIGYIRYTDMALDKLIFRNVEIDNYIELNMPREEFMTLAFGMPKQRGLNRIDSVLVKVYKLNHIFNLNNQE